MSQNNILKCLTAPKWLEYARSLPDPQMLFDAFWFEGELCFLFSDTGSGKTILAVQIAQSIATGQPIHPDVTMSAKPQKVLLCEFELSAKQFESRYTDKEENHTTNLSEYIIRAELDLTEFDFELNFQDAVTEAIYKAAIELNTRIIIVDNISFIQDVNKFDQAIKFMQKMNRIKRELNLSILVLGHTPKRNLMEPINQNSMSGSKKLMDLADSSFTIGKSSKGNNTRYLKQIKVRQDAFNYGKDNVIDIEIIKENGFLKFGMLGYSEEFRHLQQPQANQSRDNDILEAYHSGKFTQKKLAQTFGLSERQIQRIVQKPRNQADELPF